MKQYQDLLKNINKNGTLKESGRENMPNTIGINFATMSFDLSKGFPLLTTKKMFLKGIIHELLWFLRGETNIKPLVDSGVNIWTPDAYRWYKKFVDEKNGRVHGGLLAVGDNDDYRLHAMDEFKSIIKESTIEELPEDRGYRLGDLGKVYGHQWRNQNGVDQLADIITGLQTNPYSRYHIITGWNKADFKDMALPPCHLLYQFIVTPNDNGFALDLNMYQRSCDTFLGVPFNVASASLFLMIVAKVCNMEAGTFNWIGGDTHLYVTHKEQVSEQLSREPRELPFLKINKDISSLRDIERLASDDFELTGYDPHPAIKAELSVGL